MQSLSLPEGQRLWVPSGQRDVRALQAAKAVREYDADLALGFNETINQWAVFKKTGPDGQPFPVFGLGYELPTPEKIKESLYKADVRRHGAKIVSDVEAHNARVRAEQQYKTDQATAAVAEAFEWGFRKQGVHPNPRIFVPKGV
jgi:hypothetical protein